ncbi:MAG: UPF0175 family protein [Campylobacterales bacterium]|nr:UPF0175 family protein [Campylobacterales bacterium]
MTNVEIKDPWFEGIYATKFNNNPVKFLETFKELLLERHQREKRTITLLKEYEKGRVSIAAIAQKLGVDREDVLKLMEKHNIYLVGSDYDLAADDQTISKYLMNK